MELTDKIRRVYLPMRKQVFTSCLSTEGEPWIWYHTKGQGDDRFTSFD